MAETPLYIEKENLMTVYDRLAKELAEDCGLSERDAEEIVYYLSDLGLLDLQELERYYEEDE